MTSVINSPSKSKCKNVKCDSSHQLYPFRSLSSNPSESGAKVVYLTVDKSLSLSPTVDTQIKGLSFLSGTRLGIKVTEK